MTLSFGFFVDSVPFTPDVIAGTASLGGSESACLGLARALKARGHRVAIYATKLDEQAPEIDAWGVKWYPAELLADDSLALEWDVFVSLRMPAVFHRPRNARFRILWNQDLMTGDQAKMQVMACAWAYDAVVYVSEYHRKQWEGWLPELRPLGVVTKNGYDPAHVPAEVTKDPSRIIHISRPERGLGPLLEMWPALKAKVPQATLHLCRYNSMYDAGGWHKVCERYDQQVARVNEQVGGITYLGELGKAELYKAIAESAVMWYPGVADFAETSCIAAIEAQANGTPFVGSYKGALPETVPSGVLIKGDAFSPEYQRDSVDAVAQLLQDCRTQSFAYRARVNAGKAHVTPYAYAAIAEEWERWLVGTFEARYEANKLGVLRQLLHYDDHTAAKIVADEIVDPVMRDDVWIVRPRDGQPGVRPPDAVEAFEASRLCNRVIAGEDQGAEDYADRAIDPLQEATHSPRFKAVVTAFDKCEHVLDVACGNGAFAIALAQTYPSIHVTGIDYAAGNIETARKAAETAGVADRCTFLHGAAYNYETQQPAELWTLLPPDETENVRGDRRFDGAFVGEFLEHVANYKGLIDAVEGMCRPGATIVYTVPYGPLSAVLERKIPMKRGHVHHFTQRDLNAIFGQKRSLEIRFLPWGNAPRGEQTGQWLIGYQTSNAPTGERPYRERIVTTRPYARVSVGIIAGNVEHEIGKCLDSVWGFADEIVVGICGATDDTRRMVEAYDAASHVSKIRLLDLPAVQDHPDGFAGVRNEVLKACTGEWFLWIDTDEVLLRGYALGQYLESGPFLGYSIHQNHLQLDAPNHYDRPVRLFKRIPAIQFYGCVHEQPQMGDCNGDIDPGLEVFDAQIAHTGYLVGEIRRRKMLRRNLPLLERDRERFPERRLGKVLVLRDYVNLGDLSCEETGGQMNSKAAWYYHQGRVLFAREFADPADKYHELGRPFYERALQQLGMGLEVEMSLAGKQGGLNGSRAKPHRFWVQNAEEMQRLMQFKMDKAVKQFQPVVVRTDPFDEVPDGAALRPVEDAAPVA